LVIAKLYHQVFPTGYSNDNAKKQAVAPPTIFNKKEIETKCALFCTAAAAAAVKNIDISCRGPKRGVFRTAGCVTENHRCEN
jgi:hypothetical protein